MGEKLRMQDTFFPDFPKPTACEHPLEEIGVEREIVAIENQRTGQQWLRSVAVRADDFGSGTGAERPPGLQANRILDEPHRAVTETDVDAAGVIAAGRR